MALKNIVINTSGDVTSGDFEADTFFGTLMQSILAPAYTFTAAEDEYVKKADVGTAALFWGISAGLIGEAWGHKRERAGEKSFVPLMRD